MSPMSSPTSSRSRAQSFWLSWRLAILGTAAGVLLLYVLYLARGALFPFIVSIVLAQLLFPLVAAVERRIPKRDRFPTLSRIVAIAVIYICGLAGIAALLVLTVPPIFHESQEFVDTLPGIYESAHAGVEVWSENAIERIPEELRSELEGLIAAGGNVLASALQGLIIRSIRGVSNALTVIIGLVIVPFFLFYLLKDRQEVVGGALSILSPRTQQRVFDVLQLVNNVVGAYVRGQLLSATVVGVLVFIGLTILGVKFAVILAIVAGLFALIPIVGAVLGAVPGILVALASSPQLALWVALVYIVVQIFESNVIAPRIQSRAVRLHPAMVMIVLVCSSEVAGLWGMVVGVPLTAAVRDVFLYFHRTWSSESAELTSGDSERTDDSGEFPQGTEREQESTEEEHEVD